MCSGVVLVAWCCSRYSLSITAAATASTEALAASRLPFFCAAFAARRKCPPCSSSNRSASQLVRRSSTISTGTFNCLCTLARGKARSLLGHLAARAIEAQRQTDDNLSDAVLADELAQPSHVLVAIDALQSGERTRKSGIHFGNRQANACATIVNPGMERVACADFFCGSITSLS